MKLFRRKPIILECTKVLIDKERRKLEAELSLKLNRRAIILPIGVILPQYKQSNIYNKKVESTRRFHGSTTCECYECSSIETVKGNHLGKNCSKCGGALIPIDKRKKW